MRLGQRPIEADIRTLRVLLGKHGLAQPGGWLPFTVYSALPQNYGTSGTTLFGTTVSRDLVVRTWGQHAYVQTTNDGSNYWSFVLYKLNSGGTKTTIATLDTSAESPSTHFLLSSGLINAAIAKSSYLALGIQADKTGSPGNLWMFGPHVFVV